MDLLGVKAAPAISVRPLRAKFILHADICFAPTAHALPTSIPDDLIVGRVFTVGRPVAMDLYRPDQLCCDKRMAERETVVAFYNRGLNYFLLGQQMHYIMLS